MWAIMGALDCEIELLVDAMTESNTIEDRYFTFHRGILFGQEAVVTKSGVGKVLATMVAQALIERFSPTALLFTGIAGGLNTSYEIGDIILGAELLQHDLDLRPLGFQRGQLAYTELREFHADPALLGIARSAPCEHPIHLGTILTGDQFITHNTEAYRYLTRELKGDAVEMEGAAVATIAHLMEVPSLIIRTISDKADGSADVDFNAFLPEASKNSLHMVNHILSQTGREGLHSR